jgi:hypothetical protein
MRKQSHCSLCGHEYFYPEDLDSKTGMRCSSCGEFIDVRSGLPLGGTKKDDPVPVPQSNSPAESGNLPPVKRPRLSSVTPASTILNKEILENLPSEPIRQGFPTLAFFSWFLSLSALILAFTFPSSQNQTNDTLYTLNMLPSIIFGCTSAILFVQGCLAYKRF